VFPRARQDQVLTEVVGNEVVVYDEARHQAHRLNGAAAIVWRHCDGQHSVPDLTALLRRHISPEAGDELVWLALDRFEAANLLDQPRELSTEIRRLSRRRALSLAGALSVLVPVVVTLAVPSPAQAHSHEPEQPPEEPPGGIS
jgi:hypothetical protein